MSHACTIMTYVSHVSIDCNCQLFTVSLSRGYFKLQTNFHSQAYYQVFPTFAESSWVKINGIISGGKLACVQARNFCTQTEL